jgi:hypothetical protein
MDVAADPRSVLLLLVDELLEASLDTVELTLERAPDREWSRHGDYLMRLQREAQALLSRIPT